MAAYKPGPIACRMLAYMVGKREVSNAELRAHFARDPNDVLRALQPAIREGYIGRRVGGGSHDPAKQAAFWVVPERESELMALLGGEVARQWEPPRRYASVWEYARRG